MYKKFVDTTERQVIAVCISRANVDVVPLFIAILKINAAVYFVEPKLEISVNVDKLSKVKPTLLLVDKENSEIVGEADEYLHLVLDQHSENISNCIKCNFARICEDM